MVLPLAVTRLSVRRLILWEQKRIAQLMFTPLQEKLAAEIALTEKTAVPALLLQTARLANTALQGLHQRPKVTKATFKMKQNSGTRSIAMPDTFAKMVAV